MIIALCGRFSLINTNYPPVPIYGTPALINRPPRSRPETTNVAGQLAARCRLCDRAAVASAISRRINRCKSLHDITRPSTRGHLSVGRSGWVELPRRRHHKDNAACYRGISNADLIASISSRPCCQTAVTYQFTHGPAL